ncbi:MAG: hypothetical protein ACOCZ3_03150 [Bacillota bacterium]
MKLDKIREILELKPVYNCEENLNIKTACGADLMSDVLAFSQEKSLLLTGLTNPQVIRTAEMIGIKVIIFVRGKQPTPATIELAWERGIYIFITSRTMFEACGMLYEKGLKPENITEIT